jgi:hypothetical protein
MAAYGLPTAPSDLLTSDQLAQVREVGERLHAELHALLENVPLAVRRTRALGRHLNVDRNTCHRILAALQQENDAGLEVIAKLPGVAALRQFVEAVEVSGAKAKDVRSATAAVDRFATVILELGGSLSSLQRRCAASGRLAASEPLDIPDPEQTRRAMHRAAAELVGRKLDAQLTINILRPLPSDDKMLESVSVNGLIGHQQLHAHAMPFALTYTFTGPKWPLDLPEESTKLSRHGFGPELFPQFCSEPLPQLTLRQTGKEHYQQVVDTDVTDRKIDIVLGCQLDPVKHVIDEEVPVLSHIKRIRYPAEVLVFDIYLHRSLAMSSVPTVAAYSLNPAQVQGVHLSKFWHERIPMSLRLELLGPSIRNAQTTAWARHQQLTDYIFERLGWNGNEYVGYRLTQTYPVWDMYYYVSSDFSQTDSSLE